MYKGIEYTNAGSLPVSTCDVRFTKYKISHLIFRAHGVALKATELPKLILNANISGDNNLVKNIITNVPLSVLVDYCNILNGVALKSDTDMYCVLPIGSLDLTNQDLNISVKSTSDLGANAFTLDIYAERQSDIDPVLEYQYRAVPTDAVSVPNVLQVYDVSTAYNSSVVSKLFFDNNSELTIPHKIAFAKCQQMSQLETENTWGLIHSDKNIATGQAGGRRIRIEPTTAFNAFLIQYSAALNG